MYVIPPDKLLSMRDGTIELQAPDSERVRRAPIDLFFRTLADSHGRNAAAVVLSGSGADGTVGVQRIKENGGAVLAQEPQEAEFDAMPRNVIATGLVDFVLPVAALPAALIEYWRTAEAVQLPVDTALPASDSDVLREIFAVLRARTGHDFSQYKRPTLLRRIGRRMQVNNVTALAAYLAALRSRPQEVQALLRDLLISVTNFFRDPDVWLSLTAIIPNLFANKDPSDQVRVWVAGCATGEEAYSVAMMLYEHAVTMDGAPSIQVFATDIDEEAINTARQGLYPETIIADVAPERLQRFFTPEQGRYRIKKEIRDMVLFAPHNIVRDPPFSKLDLITCRNLLIYLNREMQEQVLQLFHFVLQSDGYLLLGASESTDNVSGLFTPIDKGSRLFQRRTAAMSSLGTMPSLPLARPASSNPSGRRQGTASQTQAFADLDLHVLARYGPPRVIVNEEYDIMHLAQGAGRFLTLADGEVSSNLIQMVHPDLRLELRTALFTARQRHENTETRWIRADIHGAARLVHMRVQPVHDPEWASGYMLVLFNDMADTGEIIRSNATDTEPMVQQLEEELQRTKEQLRTTIEQYETAVEEYKAANEELQAINEELRAATEELETSKEELQSVNEELITVNAELKHKVEEVSQSNNDLQNLMASTEIATIFVDRDLHVRRYTPSAQTIFNLIPTDVHRPLAHVTHKLDYPEMSEDAAGVLKTLSRTVREVVSQDGRWYMVRLLPYRTVEDKIDGVVLTFVDITERKYAEEVVRESEEQFRRAIEEAPIPIIMHAEDGQVLQISKSWTELTGYKQEDIPTFEAWLNQAYGFGADEVRQRMHSLFKNATYTADMEFDIITRTGEHRTWSFHASSPGTLRDGRRFVVGMALDITERKRAEEALRESEARLQLALDASGMGSFFWHVQEDRGEPDTRMLALFGLPADGTLTLNEALARLIHPDDRAGYADAVARATDPAGDGMLNTEIRVLHPDGSARWLAISAQTFFAGAPRRAVHMSGVAADITARKQAEAALRESEERLQKALSIETVGVIFFTFDGPFTDANDAFLSMSGYSREELTSGNLGWNDLTPPEWMERSQEALAELQTQGRSTPYEKEYVRKDGSRFWALFAGTRLNETECVEFVIDITDSKRAEAALRESEARFRTLADAVPQVIWANNAAGNATYFNQRWFDYSGLSYEESVGPGWQVIVHPDDAPVSVERWHQALARGEIFDTEYRLRRADGTYRWQIGRNMPLRNAEGQIVGWFGTATDIEDLKQAEAALRESEERFRLLVEGARDYAMFLLDPENCITFWSAGAVHVFGWTEAEALGQSGAIVFTPEDRASGEAEREISAALAQGSAMDRRWHLRKDGTRLFADGALIRLDDEHGNLRGFVKVCRDATAQRQAEEALQRARDELELRVQERTAELAQANTRLQELIRTLVTAQEDEQRRIARELHDQLGQQLSALRLNLAALADAAQDDVSLHERIEQLQQLAEALDRDVDQLAYELRPSALDDFGLHVALQQHVDAWSNRHGVQAELQTMGGDHQTLPAEIESVVYRVVQEALTNVAKHAAAQHVSVILEPRPKELRVIVEDDGKGFDGDALQARASSHQLGLPGMRERVALVGGTITVESEPGRGTTVYVRIPLPGSEEDGHGREHQGLSD